jgi:hypothetical protein
VEVRASTDLAALAASFPARDHRDALTGRFECPHCVLYGLLGSFEFVHGYYLGQCHGSGLHGSDANEAQVVQSLECWRGVDARAFDRDDAGLLQARDRLIDLSPRPIP